VERLEIRGTPCGRGPAEVVCGVSAGQVPSGGRVGLEAGDRAGLSAFRGENSGSAPDPRGSPLSLSAPRSRSASSADNLRTAPVSDSGVNANVVDAEQAGRAPAG